MRIKLVKRIAIGIIIFIIALFLYDLNTSNIINNPEIKALENEPVCSKASTDIDDPIFTEQDITLYLPEWAPLEYYYAPEGRVADDGSHFAPVATDCSNNIVYEMISENGFTGDATDAPGTYTVIVNATDNAGNSTGIDDETGIDNPNQTLTIHVVPTLIVFAYQDNYSTSVNLEFDLDYSLYPEESKYTLYIYDSEMDKRIDEILIEAGTTTYKYDQKNYETYKYIFQVKANDYFDSIELDVPMIQLPVINAFSASANQADKTININYDITLNDFIGAIAYIKINGERVATLDVAKSSLDYTVLDYGTYDIELVLDYSESADPMTLNTTVEIKAPLPSKLTCIAPVISQFEKFILSIQEFFTNILN